MAAKHLLPAGQAFELVGGGPVAPVLAPGSRELAAFDVDEPVVGRSRRRDQKIEALERPLARLRAMRFIDGYIRDAQQPQPGFECRLVMIVALGHCCPQPSLNKNADATKSEPWTVSPKKSIELVVL